MPTPLGHSLAGLTVYLVGAGTRPPRPAVYAIGLIVLANAPDIDFLPGYLSGAPRAYHWGPTHSISAALLVGTVAGIGARLLRHRFAYAFVLATLAYGSHILLDMLLGYYSEAQSVGLQVLWPFTDEQFMLPWPVFLSVPPDVERDPLGVLFSPAAIPLLTRELLALGPVTVVAWALARARRRSI